MKKLLTLCLALIATTALWASNTINYTAAEKLEGYPSSSTSYSLDVGKTTFGPAITSHTFSNGKGTITCDGEITTIGEKAFYCCSGLTKVTIPNSVTTIGEKAFSCCTGLPSVIIPNSVTTIGDNAFYYCTGLISVIIPNSVITIGNGAFCGCTELSSITIPDAVISIGRLAFWECEKLCSINVLFNTHYASIDGVLFNFAKDTLIQYPRGNTRTSYSIPNSITTIEERAFEGCKNLKTITIPNSVTSIGEMAFYNCSGLTSPIFNSYYFVRLPKSYSDSYTIPNGIKQIVGRAFEGCSGLTSVTIPNSVTIIGSSAFAECSGLTSIIIPNSVTTIENSAFYYCSRLTSVTIPNSVTTIGSSAFSRCIGLTSVTIPNSVTTIGSSAFSRCRGLTSITIPNSVTTIGSSAFAECSGLTSVVWNAKNCNGCTFGGQVESFIFGEGVEVIPDNICQFMSKLTSITIPNSVTTIGKSAFYSCSGLCEIVSKAKEPPICDTYCFKNVSESIPVYVYPHSVDAYKQAKEWKHFLNIQENPNDYVNVSCSAENGSINGNGRYVKGDSCTLTITANYGYHFTQWNDGNTDNPRTIQVMSDTTFTAQFAKNIYTISVEAEHGYISGGGNYEYLSSIQLTATADEHYHFTQWDDGNTDNPRTITIEEDKTYTAIFTINQHTISAYAEHGRVSGTGRHDYGTEATLTVIPYIGYEFATWSDGNTDNPRTVLVTEDATYNSTCTLATKGTCGNNLYWEYKDGSLIINGQGAMYNFAFDQVPWILYRDSIQLVELCEGLTNVGNNAFASCPKLTSITIPNTIVNIGISAFENSSYLKTITLGKSLTDIGCNAFKGDFRIEEITSYAEVTPNVCSSTFDGLSKPYIYLYVPENSIRGYQVDPNWNGFDIRTKSAEKKPIDGDNPIVTPTNQDVTITWPITDGTNTYTLTITKNGEVVCVLTFNANGQLTNIAFAAPGHDGAHQASAATLTTQGYQFTVTGLNPGTAYDYSVTATDAGGKTLAEHKGNFSTTGGESDLQNVRNGAKATKFFHNGNLIIERNGIKYTATGQKVR